MLRHSVNVFKGIEKNPLFIGILVVTSVLQVIMVQVGGKSLHVAAEGLSGKYWGISIAFGAGSLVVQQIINVLFTYVSQHKMQRSKLSCMVYKRLAMEEESWKNDDLEIL